MPRSRLVSLLVVPVVAAPVLASTWVADAHGSRGTDRFTAPTAVAAATIEVSGTTLDPLGQPLDDVAVSAVKVATGKEKASALSYGGAFSLWVPAGTYRIELRRKGFEPVSLTRSVTDRTELGAVTLDYPQIESEKEPRLAGTPRVGGVLRAETGTWSELDVTVSLIWLRDGEPVDGADGSRYQVRPADAGHRIAVRVRASAPQHRDGRATSDAVEVDRAEVEPSLSLAGLPLHRGDRARWSVTFDTPAWAVPGGSVLVHEGRAVLSRDDLEDGVAAGQLPRLGLGEHRLWVEYTGGKGFRESRSDAVKVVVRR